MRQKEQEQQTPAVPSDFRFYPPSQMRNLQPSDFNICICPLELLPTLPTDSTDIDTATTTAPGTTSAPAEEGSGGSLVTADLFTAFFNEEVEILQEEEVIVAVESVEGMSAIQISTKYKYLCVYVFRSSLTILPRLFPPFCCNPNN